MTAAEDVTTRAHDNAELRARLDRVEALLDRLPTPRELAEVAPVEVAPIEVTEPLDGE